MTNQERHDRIEELRNALQLHVDPRAVNLAQLEADCPHLIVPHGDYDGACCWICGAILQGQWYCPDSPDHLCHYKASTEDCDYCHQPEERK